MTTPDFHTHDQFLVKCSCGWSLASQSDGPDQRRYGPEPTPSHGDTPMTAPDLGHEHNADVDGEWCTTCVARGYKSRATLAQPEPLTPKEEAARYEVEVRWSTRYRHTAVALRHAVGSVRSLKLPDWLGSKIESAWEDSAYLVDITAAPPAALAQTEPLDVERLGLSAEQTAIMRDHLASRQQTVSEFFGDVLMEMGLGRATGKEYPGPSAWGPHGARSQRNAR